VSAIRKLFFNSLITASILVTLPSLSLAETLNGALAKAYNNNSTLNSARAGVRVTDEGVAIEKSGYRPTIEGSASTAYTSQAGTQLTTGSFGVQINQTLFDGFRTKNRIASAESQVFAARENLRNTEQNTLFNAVSAYMDVIRDQKIAALRKKNVAFLAEQVRSAKARFDVGEGTRTDMAQAEAGRAGAIALSNAADAQAKSSAAIYRQIIGEDPKDLKAGSPASKLMPKSLDQALSISAAEHPAILASKHVVDASEFGVKIAEGALLPTLGASAGVSRNAKAYGGILSAADTTYNQASVGLQLTVPIYQGGKVAATVRQQKEKAGQARIDVDVASDSVRAAVTSAWTQMVASQASVSANGQVVAAAQLALDGVSEERKVGQRTTLDVLNAQSQVVDAQLAFVDAQRNVVVASYAVLSATGRLSASRLGLGVGIQDPEEHYIAVKDKWFGLRTPDGR
jgi:outer membrane protein